jgi:hypothetical protein
LISLRSPFSNIRKTPVPPRKVQSAFHRD